MFIPLKMVLIGIDPYPYIYIYVYISAIFNGETSALLHHPHGTPMVAERFGSLTALASSWEMVALAGMEPPTDGMGWSH